MTFSRIPVFPLTHENVSPVNFLRTTLHSPLMPSGRRESLGLNANRRRLNANRRRLNANRRRLNANRSVLMLTAGVLMPTGVHLFDKSSGATEVGGTAWVLLVTRSRGALASGGDSTTTGLLCGASAASGAGGGVCCTWVTRPAARSELTGTSRTRLRPLGGRFVQGESPGTVGWRSGVIAATDHSAGWSRPGRGRPGGGRPGGGRPGGGPEGRPGEGRPGGGRPGLGRPGQLSETERRGFTRWRRGLLGTFLRGTFLRNKRY